MKTHYIKRNETLTQIRDRILAAPRLGIDTETTGLDPLSDQLRLLQIAVSNDESFVFDLRFMKVADPAFDFLRDVFRDEKKVKMFHNAKFDIRFLKRHFGATEFNAVHDTYLASVLLACADDTIRHNLAAVAARYARIEIDKTLQRSDFSGEISDDQIRYSAIDAMALHPISASQIEWLTKQSLERCAMLEFDAVDAMADLENMGFYLDKDQWLARCAEDEKSRDASAKALNEIFLAITEQHNLFGGVSDINLDAPDQINEALRKLGVPVEDSTTEWKIKHLVKDYPVVGHLLDYRGHAQALKTFGVDYVRFIHNLTGRIHADFKQIGTPTGRMTCKDPNLQQLPSDKRFRSCFKAQSADRKLIVADYSQIEMRIMAQFSRDEKLLDAYNTGKDLHTLTASEVFNIPFDQVKKDGDERALGKRLNFGTAYGIGAARFAANAGLSVDDSQKHLDKYWSVYKGLDKYMRDREQAALDESEVRTFSGRCVRLRYDDSDKQSVSFVRRAGRNIGIQGTGSDIMKRAIFLLARELRRNFTNACQVNNIHDEVVVECDAKDAEAVKACVEERMIAAGHEVLTALPCEVDAKIVDVWSK